MGSDRFRLLPLLAVALLTGAPVTARASDYSNECKSSDGTYLIVDGVLEKTGDPPGTSRPYRIIEDRILAETQGYCVSSNPDANGDRFGYLSPLAGDSEYVRCRKLPARGPVCKDSRT